MSTEKVEYSTYENESRGISSNIEEIQTELNNSDNYVKAALADASGRWAASDESDWADIKNKVQNDINTLNDLMAKANGNVKEIQDTENQYAGFNGR